ncbi:HAD domain-containing protein [Variovorax sp. YR216]|uniref:HAD domain-containing protein n=1 Tax=Variovorax sp. YR216 TaxID=1882828 RepID=UPI000B84FC74|nr:HAD domain-containing protein [Variovorax sp. YR216]
MTAPDSAPGLNLEEDELRDESSFHFDGVLHPAGEPPGTTLPFEWIDLLAALLEPFDDVQVVIHSSWREHFSAPELTDFLEPVADRLLGAVDEGPKATAIERFLREHPQVTDALVLDDQVDEFPRGFPATLLACEPGTGLSSKETQQRLKNWLLRVAV